MTNLITTRNLKKTLIATASVAVLAAAAWFAVDYWKVGRFEVATDDAYVQADYTAIAPKVSGYIGEVLVNDNQHVQAGQLLARIDDRDFRTALLQAKADTGQAQAEIGNIDAQLSAQRALVDQAQANIAASEAALKFARQDQDRYQDLMKTGYGTVQRAQQADATLRTNSANVQRDRAALVAAREQIKVLEAQRVKAEAQLEHDRAVEHQAELNLGYTSITAPIDGTVGARQVRVGQLVQAGTQLMAVVPLHAVYVVANLKETQLTRVSAGEPAEVTVDAFPGQAIKGRVDSIAPASGLQFALLPPDNATGNFTKIVQRVPVRIRINAGPESRKVLVPGLSLSVEVDTRSAKSAIETIRNEQDRVASK